ncbi:hypothetical protein [Metabacillus hrfriensis]|uniref:Uncharacterized protein n=1 Tax=Metabacillus hrfriensis TaxID=3048891 RepID=A0ACD4RAP3_9BACI|nr:hypothetical protein [Metabacillus sp. CT-WN-B3]UOK57787.1 hypothetical protein MGI18_26305 [Bacillus sp. OVS6]WHZ57511.1 hypothetical protein QLQ22_23175 [Metabacillus sp. CT-WN-B3]
MAFSKGDRVKIVHINYNHSKRVNKPMPTIIGMNGIIHKPSLIEDDAYNVKLDGGQLVLLYDDEIELLYSK